MLEIKNLSFGFGGRKVLEDVNFTIDEGESVLIAGKNGAGKTTLLRCLNGIFNNYEGQILLNNKKIEAKDRYSFGYLPSSLSFYDKMKIGESIDFHKSIYPYFSLITFPDYKLETNRRIEELSKGEKVLFYLILVLSHNPSYFFIDDILHLLDPYLRETFLNILIERMEEKKLSVIISSQTFSDIEGLPVKLIILDKGKIILKESVETLKRAFFKVTAKKIPEDLPVIYKKDWGDFEEGYLYPYERKKSEDLKMESVKLSEIIKSIIGGNYVKKRD